MKTYAIADIKALCADPSHHFDVNKKYTLLDVLSNETCPAEDKIRIVLHLLDDKPLRLFIIWCIREAQFICKPHDIGPSEVCIERIANGEASGWALREIAKDIAVFVVREAARNDAAGTTAVISAWKVERRKQIEKLKELIKGGYK